MEVEVISRKIPFDKLQSVSYIRYMLISLQLMLWDLKLFIFILFYLIVIGFIVNQTRWFCDFTCSWWVWLSASNPIQNRICYDAQKSERSPRTKLKDNFPWQVKWYLQIFVWIRNKFKSFPLLGVSQLNSLLLGLNLSRTRSQWGLGKNAQLHLIRVILSKK